MPQKIIKNNEYKITHHLNYEQELLNNYHQIIIEDDIVYVFIYSKTLDGYIRYKYGLVSIDNEKKTIYLK